MADYVHRIGRAARAGKAGHSVLFLLPSETQYLEALKIRGLNDTIPLSLTSTLHKAFSLSETISQQLKTNKINSKKSHDADVFASAVQLRAEELVSPKDKTFDNIQNNLALKHTLAESARSAFTSFVRAYPTKE